MRYISQLPHLFGPYWDKRVVVVLCLGFASGLPLSLVMSSLSVWLAEGGISKTDIALFAYLGTPYVLKFLWAPFVDHLQLGKMTRIFGKRRGWLLTTQIILMTTIAIMALNDPMHDLSVFAWCTLAVAIASATQDIVVDAYRIELFDDHEQGIGAATAIFGYRLGMMVSSAGCLIVAHYFGWQMAYLVMANFVLIGVGATLLGKEPSTRVAETNAHLNPAAVIRQVVVRPFTRFMEHKSWLLILVAIILYKFGDAFVGIMTNPFLLEVGFNKADIAYVVKIFGFGAVILGGFFGGLLIARMQMYNALILCGLLQLASNFIFIIQYYVGDSIGMLAVTISIENITSGMGTAVFVAYISSLCDKSLSATQYALLSAFASLGRTLVGGSSGVVVDAMGWIPFFVASMAIALPGIVLFVVLKRKTRYIPTRLMSPSTTLIV